MHLKLNKFLRRTNSKVGITRLVAFCRSKTANIARLADSIIVEFYVNMCYYDKVVTSC